MVMAANIPGKMVLGYYFTVNLVLTVPQQSSGNDTLKVPAGLMKKRN
jgi:hypothetical protein